MIRPGPEHLPPASAPGGLVLRVYDLAGGLLVDRALPLDAGADVERFAAVDAEVVAALDAGVVLVVYDGDSGERWTLDDWAALL